MSCIELVIGMSCIELLPSYRYELYIELLLGHGHCVAQLRDHFVLLDSDDALGDPRTRPNAAPSWKTLIFHGNTTRGARKTPPPPPPQRVSDGAQSRCFLMHK